MARLDHGEVRISQLVTLEASDIQLVDALGGNLESIVDVTLQTAKEICEDEREPAMPVPEGVNNGEDCAMTAEITEIDGAGARSVSYACSGRVCAYAGICMVPANDLAAAFDQTRKGEQYGLPHLIRESQKDA